MQNKIYYIVMTCFFVCSEIFFMPVHETEAGVLTRSVAKVAARKAAARKAAQKTVQKKSASRATDKKVSKHEKNYKEIAAHDLHRDRDTKVKPLKETRIVRRYTSTADAKHIKANGLPPETHMTARIPQGRSISANKAKKRYGIENKPEARLTIQIPKGHPVKKNKVIGGAPGWGEITSPRHIPSKNIVKVDNIR